MLVPDWATSRAGTRVRVALWLYTEVRQGGVFTKAQLRNAFPAVEQVDRRMRDLRPEGWVIATYREDRSLAPDELRLIQTGGAVWQPGYRSRQVTVVSEADRRTILAADNYMCIVCGIAAGEPYVDDPVRTAKLTVGTSPNLDARGRHLRVLCDRCCRGDWDIEPGDRVIADILGLDDDSRQRLRDWINAGQRFPTQLEVLWTRYRRLALDEREAVRRALIRDLES